MKKLKWPVTKEMHAYMKMRQNQNRIRFSAAEEWAFKELKTRTTQKWTRQAQWGYRLFDFWSGALGCAVEIDGPEHNVSYDTYRDKYNFERSNIVVLRVKNFNASDMNSAILRINALETWETRKIPQLLSLMLI